MIRVENPFVLPPTTKGYHPRPVLTNPGFLGSLYGPAAPGAPDRPWNRHAMNNSLARNKLSVTIDTRKEMKVRELLMRLAESERRLHRQLQGQRARAHRDRSERAPEA